MLSLKYIIKVAEFDALYGSSGNSFSPQYHMDNTGPEQTFSPSYHAHAATQHPVATMIDNRQKSIVVDLIHVLHPSGDVTIAHRSSPLPEGAKITD